MSKGEVLRGNFFVNEWLDKHFRTWFFKKESIKRPESKWSKIISMADLLNTIKDVILAERFKILNIWTESMETW